MAVKPSSYFLIGIAEEHMRIISLRSKTITLRQMLQNFVFYHLENGESIKEAASSVMKNAMLIWNELGFKAKRIDKCEKKVIKLYNEWNKLLSRHNAHPAQSDKLKSQIAKFTDQLDKNFDVNLIETPTEATQSSSEGMDTSETEMDVTLDVEMNESPVEIQEEGPGPSGQSEVSAKKRSSAMKAIEKVKTITKKSSDTDEEGKTTVIRYIC